MLGAERRHEQDRCCSGMSLVVCRPFGTKLCGVSKMWDATRHETELLLPCNEACEVSEVGEPPSARPSKLEIDGREHLEVSSIGGEGGPCGCAYP